MDLIDKDDRIKKLQNKRFCLRDKIKAKLDKGIDKAYVKDDVVLFNDLTDQLSSMGVHTSIKVEYLKLDNYKDIVSKKEPVKQIYKKSIPKPIPIKKQSAKISDKPNENNYYILNLAWSEKADTKFDYNQITEVIIKYFKELGLNEISNDIHNIGNIIQEHIIKYEFKGTEKEFNLLKKSAIYMLDFLSKDEMDIAIYGKQRNY